MDELNELEGLTTIGKNSTRGGQTSDFHHDVENQRFTVSDAIYAQHDLNNHGFIFHVGNGKVYVSIQPNDDSVSYKGREGSTKGKQFTSSVTSELMSKAGLVGNLELTKVGTKNGVIYFRINMATNEPEEVEVETTTEELV